MQDAYRYSAGYDTENRNFNNNKISINIFLQEHCKDALNLKDFVDSLRIELNDVSKLQIEQ